MKEHFLRRQVSKFKHLCNSGILYNKSEILVAGFVIVFIVRRCEIFMEWRLFDPFSMIWAETSNFGGHLFYFFKFCSVFRHNQSISYFLYFSYFFFTIKQVEFSHQKYYLQESLYLRCPTGDGTYASLCQTLIDFHPLIINKVLQQ